MWGVLEKARTKAPVMGSRGCVIGDDVDPADRLQAAGKDHAEEATARVLEHAFMESSTRSIKAITSPHNLSSRRLMSRLGFTYRKDVVACQGPRVLHAINRQDRRAGYRCPGHRGGISREAS